MTARITDQVGLVIDDDPLPSPARAVELARAYITERATGLDEWDLAALLDAIRPQRAHWGGDDLGFVGQDHELARPVVVVNLPPHIQAQLVPPAKGGTA